MTEKRTRQVKIKRMRWASLTAILCLAAALPGLAGSNSSADAPPATCANGVPGGVNCIVSRQDVKQARLAYARGIKFRDHHQVEEAYTQFEEATRRDPRDTEFFSARELAKSQLVFLHTERGNALLASGQRAAAAAEFHAALELDPDDTFVGQQLKDALQDPATQLDPAASLAESTEIRLEPSPARATFHYSGDVHGLFTQLGAAYGVTVAFDDSAPTKPVRFNVDDADFFTALQLASLASKTMWTALDAHQVLIAADNSENHKQFDRMSLGTFRVPGAATPQEATELVNSLRSVCDFQKISSGSGQIPIIEVRAPQPMLRACSTLLEQLSTLRPQVMLDIKVFDISHNLARNIGVHIPNTFTLYNIPVAALAGLGALGGQNIQSLINQLVASGGINQAGTSAISGLLAQLQGQGNSIFSTPLATFGGGLTFMGLSLDHFAAELSVNESWSRLLEHTTLRAGQGKEATFHLGTRYPILNASYAPIFNSPQISQVLGNQSYQAPFPSVSYEDLGLNMKTTPVVHGGGEISMKLELQLRSLTGQSTNGVPVISNKEYTGSIRLEDGQPAVIAGEVSNSETRSLSGIPGLGQVPLFNQAMVNNTLNVENDELLIVVTPHVVSNRERGTGEIWVSAK